MPLDDPESIARFISLINGSKGIDEHKKSEGAKTPPNVAGAGEDPSPPLTSPEVHPKQSPHVSGLRAPYNTPKTVASSPRLGAANTHNEDVAEAFAAYVNSVETRPLSESIWAPANVRHRSGGPSTLGGAARSKVLIPVKAVEPNPAINETFDRMSFRAADANQKMGENLIGDGLTRSVFSKAPSTTVNPGSSMLTRESLVTDKLRFNQRDGAEPPHLSSTQITSQKPVTNPVANTAVEEDDETHNTTHLKATRVSGLKSVTNPFETDAVGEDPKAQNPPHLTSTRASNLKPVTNKTQVKLQGHQTGDDLPKPIHTVRFGKENEAPTPETKVPPHLRLAPLASQKPVKADMNPVVTSKSTEPDFVIDAVRATTNRTEPKGTTGPAATTSAELSKTTGPAAIKHLAKASSTNEDLQHKTFFTEWPKLEERSRPAAKVRKVVIKDLPHESTNAFVASLVYGGPIEEIQIRSSAAGNLSAIVRFMDAGDCMKFYDETSNGLVYKKDDKGGELVLFVELAKDVDVVGGLLQTWIASGVTRCVRAVGVESEWGMDELLKIAERKNRKVEKIVDGQNAGGARSVVFRFCKVEDAVQFKGALSRDEEWEQCNIHYAADPCAIASGVHFES